MSENDRELMERYIYEVVNKLPKKQRDDISMELRELIGDMTEEKPMDEVLKELGNPEVFAEQYRGEKRQLIGPAYYGYYITFLKIALPVCLMIAVLSGIAEIAMTTTVDHSTVGIAIEDTVSGWVDTTGNVFGKITENIFSSLFGAFAIITLIFAILERQNVNINDLVKGKEKDTAPWSPDKLQPIPNPKAVIGKTDTIVSMVFTLIFGGLLAFAPNLFSAYHFHDGHVLETVPIFNMDNWNITLIFIVLAFLISFLEDVVKLVKGCYCKIVLATGIVSGIIRLVLTIIIFKALPLFNQSFFRDIKELFGITDKHEIAVLDKISVNDICNSLLGLFIFILCLELGYTIYKTVRYGRDME